MLGNDTMARPPCPTPRLAHGAGAVQGPGRRGGGRPVSWGKASPRRGGRMRVLVVGPSGAGKDTACEYLARVTNLRFAGTTSLYLAKYVAARLGVSEEEAYRTRHAN